MGLLQNYSYNRLVLLFTIAIVKSNTSLATVGLRRKLQRKRKRRCRMRKSVGGRNSSEILLLLYNTLYCLKGLLELRTHCTLHANVHVHGQTQLDKLEHIRRKVLTNRRQIPVSSADVHSVDPFSAVIQWLRFSSVSYHLQLECGPMPNVMVALPIIDDALCSTPQFG